MSEAYASRTKVFAPLSALRVFFKKRAGPGRSPGGVWGGALAGFGAAPRQKESTMETAYYTVQTINGDYAYLVSDQGVENQVAMFLLPEGTDVGSRLKCEDFQWTLVEP